MKLSAVCVSISLALILGGCCCNPFNQVKQGASACYGQVRRATCTKSIRCCDKPMFSDVNTEVGPRPMMVGPKWSNADSYNGLDKVTNTETL